jgi:hypothetical protein
MTTSNLLKTILILAVLQSSSCRDNGNKKEQRDSLSSSTLRNTQIAPVLPHPIPECDIKTLNERFIAYSSAHHNLTFKKPYVKISANTINKLLDNNNFKFVLAVMGIDDKDTNKKELQIDFIGSDANGTGIGDPNTADLDKIKKRHKGLKDKSDPTKKLRLIGLNDFPIVIKLDKESLGRIRSAGCEHYYFYPGIDTSWRDHAPDENTIHFTISVIGGELRRCLSNGKLDTSLLKPNEQTARPAEETWPYDQFIWYEGGDIIGL